MQKAEQCGCWIRGCRSGNVNKINFDISILMIIINEFENLHVKKKRCSVFRSAVCPQVVSNFDFPDLFFVFTLIISH